MNYIKNKTKTIKKIMTILEKLGNSPVGVYPYWLILLCVVRRVASREAKSTQCIYKSYAPALFKYKFTYLLVYKFSARFEKTYINFKKLRMLVQKLS